MSKRTITIEQIIFTPGGHTIDHNVKVFIPHENPAPESKEAQQIMRIKDPSRLRVHITPTGVFCKETATFEFNYSIYSGTRLAMDCGLDNDLAQQVIAWARRKK